MNYYRLTFKRVTVVDPVNRPLDRKWEWFDLICKAQNRDLAKAHGQHVAADRGVDFVDAMRLLRVVGAAQINREPAFQPLSKEASMWPLKP